jgi:hypothetical protein
MAMPRNPLFSHRFMLIASQIRFFQPWRSAPPQDNPIALVPMKVLKINPGFPSLRGCQVCGVGMSGSCNPPAPTAPSSLHWQLLRRSCQGRARRRAGEGFLPTRMSWSSALSSRASSGRPPPLLQVQQRVGIHRRRRAVVPRFGSSPPR